MFGFFLFFLLLLHRFFLCHLHAPFSSFNELSLHTVSLPGTAPGASDSALRFFASITSIPSIFLAALHIFPAFPMTISTLFAFLYFLPLFFPFPALNFLFCFALSTSSIKPSFSSISVTFLVLSICSSLSSTIIGSSLFPSLWPLFFTSSFIAVAAIADSTAFFFSLRLIFSLSIFSTFGGWAAGPLTACGTNATFPAVSCLLFLSLGSLECSVFIVLYCAGWPLEPIYQAVYSLPAPL